jgi:hypothetical protein
LVWRVIRAALLISGAAAWLALAVCYAFDVSPVDQFDLTLRWARHGDRPPVPPVRELRIGR